MSTNFHLRLPHPQANGMVERAIQQLNDSLRTWFRAKEWPQHLLWVPLGLPSAECPHQNSCTLTLAIQLTTNAELLLVVNLLCSGPCSRQTLSPHGTQYTHHWPQ